MDKCKHSFVLATDNDVIAEDEIITLKCNNLGCSEERVFKISVLVLKEIQNG